MILEFVLQLVKIVVIFAAVMTMVPVMIWAERKVVADFQVRVGPNRVGPFGALQPLADALKLLMKEDITPSGADRYLFFLAPLMAIVPAIVAVAVIPFGPAPWTRITDFNHSLLFSLAISSISVYAITLAGWASNNKYSLMGALRASAQMISYEMGMGLSIIALLMVTGTLSLRRIVELQHLGGWNIFQAPTIFIAFFIYLICGIAETNRAPFDLAEAESELVAGFHTEYSSFKFAMFFMGEYVNMVTVSCLATALFFGGWSGPGVSFSAEQLTTMARTGSIAAANVSLLSVLLGVFWFVFKAAFFLYLYIWLRATLPRLRYDQLMRFGWKRLLPLSLANIFFVAMFYAWHNGWFNGG